MALHKIKKQKLLAEPFSEDALKLIKAIYYTYIELGEELNLELQLQTVEQLLKLENTEQSKKYITELLEEINEPLVVKDFKFYTEVYPMRFLVFCSYTIEDEILNIEISEEYLLAEKKYMLDSFLSK